MDIFGNDSQVLQIGHLTIENHPNSVVISGDVEIYKNTFGKEQATLLLEFAQELVNAFATLSEQDLGQGAQKGNQESPITLVDNPFL